MSEQRRCRNSLVALLTLIVATAVAGSLVASAAAESVSREKLESSGWTCVEFIPANRFSCFNPGLGRPFPGNPDPRPTYNFLAFDRTSGDFIGTGHLVRDDLYNGRQCASSGAPYVFRAPIGYWECVHPK